MQSGVVSRSYPYLLFKGITTYGWPDGFCFLHGLIDKLKHLLGFKASQAVVLNAMGYDACDGTITLDEETEKIRVTPPHDPLLPKKIQALQKLTKKLGGILFMSRYRCTTVHLLGGCNAASDSEHGVCSPKGQVFKMTGNQSMVHQGLYVCDASLIPCSIGINPCLTITTVAEHVSRHLVQDVLRLKSTVQSFQIKEESFRAQHARKDSEFGAEAVESHPLLASERSDTNQQYINEDLAMGNKDKVTVKETLRGFIGGMPCRAYLVVKLNSADEIDCNQKDSITGESYPLLKGRVSGHVILQAVNKDKLYIVDGKVDMCKVDSRTPYTQYMHYRLILASSSGSR